MDLKREAYGPKGDSATHLSMVELEAGLARLPEAPKNRGRLVLISSRQPDGARETPSRVRLTPEEGVPGDGWNRRPPRDPEAQIAVMRMDLAELIAGGQSVTLSGDNLFVDLDLSAANLPARTRLRVGEALVEVTPEPHDGCAKFKGRFGQDALVFMQAPATRHENRRGIYWKVVEPGDVRVGDGVEVVSRP